MAESNEKILDFLRKNGFVVMPDPNQVVSSVNSYSQIAQNPAGGFNNSNNNRGFFPSRGRSSVRGNFGSSSRGGTSNQPTIYCHACKLPGHKANQCTTIGYSKKGKSRPSSVYSDKSTKSNSGNNTGINLTTGKYVIEGVPLYVEMKVKTFPRSTGSYRRILANSVLLGKQEEGSKNYTIDGVNLAKSIALMVQSSLTKAKERDLPSTVFKLDHYKDVKLSVSNDNKMEARNIWMETPRLGESAKGEKLNWADYGDFDALE